MKKTPLYHLHKSLNAKMAPFGGYLMPIQYDSLIKEHLSVRNNLGVFDVSHMGNSKSAEKTLLNFYNTYVAMIFQKFLLEKLNTTILQVNQEELLMI